MKFKSLLLVLFALVILSAAAPLQSFHLNSSVFSQGQPIPRSYTYDGGNQIPPLNWFGEPSGTQQFALLVYDQDAPQADGKTAFIQWLVYGIPEGTNDITGALLAGTPQAPNSFGFAGWNGPVPPKGAPAHHYVFTLYALDTVPTFLVGATSAQVLAAINGHVLAEATLMGTYQRD
jgi:Raf kinase inhibitor-like YbhB/YbcL family protein